MPVRHQRPQREGPLDHGKQEFHIAWLGQELVRNKYSADNRISVSVAREDDACNRGVRLLDAFKKGSPVHPWHPHVRHNQVELALVEQLERLFSVRGEHHMPLPPLPVKEVPERLQHMGFVIDEQNRIPADRYIQGAA